jgi:hypothetical protein
VILGVVRVLPSAAAIMYAEAVTIRTAIIFSSGDILPGTNSVRGLAAMETVVGQFYIGVFIAHLIGIRVAKILAGPGREAAGARPPCAGMGELASGEPLTRPGDWRERPARRNC